ncbi:hypothetical protein INR49_031228, partial [Caranx melampygus]
MDTVDRSPGQITNFRKDDFEANWIKVAECRFGQVYQVKLKLWREKCALKSYDSLCADNFYRRITDEASKITKVKFKYIMSIYGLCTEATAVVMEYMSNGSLNNLLVSHTLMWGKKFQMIHEASMGMNFLHSMEPPLLHLNLKTSNILLDDHLHIKISDFALIHWEEGMSKKLFMEHLIARGNISYIPPETFTQCPDPPGTTFDVYSFGIVMWEILTQQKPYAGCSVPKVLLEVSHGKRPCVEMLPDRRPPECDQMIRIMRQCWDQVQCKRPRFSDILMKTETLREVLNVAGPIHCCTDSNGGSDDSSLVPPLHKIALPTMPDLPSDDLHGMNEILSLLHKKDFGIFKKSVKREHVYTRFSGEKSLLHYTVASGDMESVEQVLSLGADVNCNGDDRTVRLLLDKGAVVDAREKAGWTPLHLACQNGHETVVRLLLSRLSEEAMGECEEAQGRTPLHLASAYGHLNIAKLLLSQGADPNAVDHSLSTALHLSAEEGHNRVVRELVKSGANTDGADSRGYTPLHLAALKGHTGICRQLLSKGANPNSKTLQGWTPMHLAALRGHETTVVQLHSLGGCVNVTGENGWTPLHLACKQSEPEVVAKLLAAKADPNMTEGNVNAVNSEKATPLHLAAHHSCVPIVKALLLNGADRTRLDCSGFTALNIAQ